MLRSSIDSICVALSSSKIRERNDALERLQDINFNSTSTKNVFDRDLLLNLVDSLANYIATERTIFEKSNTNTVVEVRLNKVSSILRSVIVHLWCSKRFLSLYKPRQSERIINLLLSNLTYSPVNSETQIFEPTAINSAKAISHLLKNQVFRDHLYITTCESILKSSFKCLEILVSNDLQSSKSENLIVEIFTLVYEFLNPSYSSDNIIFSSSGSKEQYYSKLFQIIIGYFRNIFADNKRERESLIYVFKIINKCLIDLSAVDVKLCHRFYRLGSKFILEVKAITLKKLISELAIFFNLVSPFISLEKLHKITGDNWNINSYGELMAPVKETSFTSTKSDRFETSDLVPSVINPSSDVDDSIIISDGDGDGEHSFVNNSTASNSDRKRKHCNEKQDSSTEELYPLAKVIEVAFNLFNDTSVQNQFILETESINLHLFPITEMPDIDLVRMRYLSLAKGSPSTPWLLRLGVVRLLISFYELKYDLSQKVSDYNLSITTKRQRTAEMRLGLTFQLSDYLQCFSNPLDFLMSLILEEPFQNNFFSVTVIQFLIFFLNHIASTDSSIISEQCLNFVLINQENILKDMMTILERQDSTQKYWILLALDIFYSIISNFKCLESTTQKKLLGHNFNKLLKYCLELLKEPATCRLACTILSHFVLYNFVSKSTLAYLDKSIIQQYENIIDLSEINGPAILCKEAIFFWILTLEICKNFKFNSIKVHNTLNTYDSQLYSHKISNWFIAKLDQLPNIVEFYHICIISMFLSWISGADAINVTAKIIYPMESFYEGGFQIVSRKILRKKQLNEYILKNKSIKRIVNFCNVNTHISAEKLLINDSTKHRVQTLVSSIMESLLDNQNDNKIIGWCFAFKIFLCESDTGYRSVVDRFVDYIGDRFGGFRNDKNFKFFLNSYFETFCSIPECWIAYITSIIPLFDLMDISLYELNSQDNDNGASMTLEYDAFDSFMPTRTNNTISVDSFPDYSVYNYLHLLQLNTFEQKATKTCLKLSLKNYTDIDEALATIVKFTSKINSKFHFIASQFVILEFVKSQQLSYISDQTIDIMFNHLTSLLEDHITKTNECSLILIGNVFTLFCKRWMYPTISGIDSDGKDVYDFLTNLFSKNMIYTECVSIVYFNLSLNILAHLTPPITSFERNSLLNIVQTSFPSLSNSAKCQVSDSIKKYIKQASSDKFEIYTLFVKSFENPQQSLESAATFCFFMTNMSSCSESLIITTICNLLELSNFQQILDYLPYTIAQIVTSNHIPSSHILFWNFKEVFFKCWGSFEFSIETFPYKLFDFETIDDFFLKNYKEITALSLAYNQKLVIPFLSKVISMKESSIVNDSVALSITLSWTSGGVKNKIFKSFEKYFSSSKGLKISIKEQFILIVFQLFRFCDCSSETNLASIFETTSIPYKNELFVKESPKIEFLDEYDIYIKPKSCIDMINYFSDTCGIDKVWTPPIVYHLASKLLLLVDSSILSLEKILHLRKLKLLYLLAPSGFTNVNVCEIITRNLVLYLNDNILMNDAANILNCILLANVSPSSNVSIEVWFLILHSLFDGSRLNKLPTLFETIIKIKDKVQLEEYTLISDATIEIMQDKEVSYNFDIVKLVSLIANDNKNGYILIKLVSSLFERSIRLKATPIKDLVPHFNKEFIQNLFDFKNKYTAYLSNSMIVWMGKCFGMYYETSGGVPHADVFEYNNYIINQNNKYEFNKLVGSLDLIFKLMINEMPSSTLKTRYCFETIVGVILYKKNVSHEDITSYISYFDLFESFEKYIYPMGNYMCSLSIDQVENDNLIYYRHGLEQALNGFSTAIKVYKFEKWLTQILFSIINELSSHTSIIILLANYICHISSFSIKCFCPLILYFIENQPIKRGNLIGKMIHDFFAEDIKKLSTDSIELFVELVLLIRIGTKNGNTKFINTFRHFDIPPIYEAALYIGKNKAALMLFEDYYTSIDLVSQDQILTEPKYTTVLKEIYDGIADKDLVFGLPIVPKLEYGLEILKNNNITWGEMMFNNAKFESGLLWGDYSKIDSINDITTGMVAMGWSGVSNILSEYSNELTEDKNNLRKDIFYEQLWKLNQWDISGSTDFDSENKCVYSVLKQIQEAPFSSQMICNDSIEKLMKLDISFFKTAGDTLSDSVLAWVRTLSLFNTIEHTTSMDEHKFKEYIKNSKQSTRWFHDARSVDFENLILVRRASFELMSQYGKTKDDQYFTLDPKLCWNGIINELHNYTNLMTEKKLTQKSINSAVYLDQIATQKFNGDNVAVNRIAKYNLANAFWTQQSDTRFPVETLKEIINTDNKKQIFHDEECTDLPEISPEFIMAMLAKWCDECKQETSSAIMTTYIEPIVERLNGILEYQFNDVGLTYHIIARFCDDQIRKTSKETTMEKLTRSISSLEHDMKSLTKYIQQETTKEKKRYALQDLNRLKIRYKSQSKELAAAKTERDMYIQKAISFYFKSIALNSDNDDMENDVDRFCSLWIEHNDIELDEDELLNLPSSRFVAWNNQLTSRILNEDSSFQHLLRKIIILIATQHPFHTLYLIKSLIITKKESDDEAAKSRGTVAEKIWVQLQGPSVSFNTEGIPNILTSIDAFADKAVLVANAKLKNNRNASILKFPDGKWWLDILNTLSLPSPVKSLPIQRHGAYKKDELPIILKIDETIVIASSGVSHPKIMKMMLSTGETQKMLLKAPDDLRQDAIMKQVFEKVNKLLWRDIETRKRNLRIRTYNVLPLGPTSGVLEFVANSMPLIDILKLLHKRDEMDINEARLKMKEFQGQSKNVRYQTYKEICKNIHPSLKFFFFNNFTSSDSWFESRKLYCHGIATTSITGYILGIGDRHCNNILLDKSSGEPIHIDFGVAFEQGKALPIPETVPFRLTRDIVDGLGITGVHGMFDKSCEHVLRVLRYNTQYICGILDVLKYDPLYSWTLSPLRRKKLQQLYFNNEENNRDFKDFVKKDLGSEANAAIETVKVKLNAKGLSNEAVVRELIHEAVDPHNLAVIFMGWSPFL